MASVKFGSHLKEMRIVLCQSSKSSEGVRNFIEQQYVPLKTSNPKFPFLIRECSSIEPKLYARYKFGVERHVTLANLEPAEILGKVQELASLKI